MKSCSFSLKLPKFWGYTLTLLVTETLYSCLNSLQPHSNAGTAMRSAFKAVSAPVVGSGMNEGAVSFSCSANFAAATLVSSMTVGSNSIGHRT